MIGRVKSLNELFEIELRYAYDCEQGPAGEKAADAKLTQLAETSMNAKAERAQSA